MTGWIERWSGRRKAAGLAGLVLAATTSAIGPAAAEQADVARVLPPTSTEHAAGRMNAVDRRWEDWLARTGERQPDFARMPSIPDLLDPLTLRAGSGAVAINTPEQWQQQRRWIREQYERWVFGRMPPPPGNMRSVPVSQTREGNVAVRHVRLEFGPGHHARLNLELMIPPGKGPFPVFLTQHPRTNPWVNTAVRQSYIGCVYHAHDPGDGLNDDADQFIEAYPDHDFSCLARWAWAGMRAVDYLVGLPQVDPKRIGIAGFSRNSKQALLAGAFDSRIGAVIARSGLTGEANPWRYTTDIYATESIEQITGLFPHWFHPRLRFFAGREHKLPVDQNLLMAMVAPRGLLLDSAWSEVHAAQFGIEQAYRSAKRVYEFLGHPERIWLSMHPGVHGTTAGEIEGHVDFLDAVFGRRNFAKQETWVLNYTLPRLGFFIGRENLVPVDYDDLLAAFAPRPALVVAPALDRYARVEDVRRLVEGARERGATVDLDTPDDFNRYPVATQKRVVDWLVHRASTGAPH